MLLSEEQVSQWKSYRDDMFEDNHFMQSREKQIEEREKVVLEMSSTLQEFLVGNLDNEMFKDIYQRKTANDWASFGLGGFSGAMFLNMLVKYVPNQDKIADFLRLTLAKPYSVSNGHELLSDFMKYLKELVDQGVVGKRKIQPAHLPFFVSSWWHIQSREHYPIYYTSARKSFVSESIYNPIENPVDDYFSFRESYLSLADKLDLNVWGLENLCVWLREPKETNNEASISVKGNAISSLDATLDDDSIDEVNSDISHTQVQYILAKIGKNLGCNVWIARNDRNRMWNDKRLGDFSLETLPPYIVADPEAQKIIELIDVLWLKGSRGVAAAFEVEHTTAIYSGLLRMSDLLTLQPNISFPLYIVTSENRLDKVRKQLSRPTFQTLQLHENCGFFAYEVLLSEAKNIIKWSRHPEVIDELAEYVSTVFYQ